MFKLFQVAIVDHETVTFEVPPGIGVNISIRVKKYDYVSDELQFSYDPPYVTSVNPNWPNAEGAAIEIRGNNFGSSLEDAGNVTVFVGDVPCLPVSNFHTSLNLECSLNFIRSCLILLGNCGNSRASDFH